MAVAIGVGIAGAIVGIACVAIISRRLMKKKQATEESEQQPQPDEPWEPILPVVCKRGTEP